MFLNGIFQCTAQRYCNHCNQIKKVWKIQHQGTLSKNKKIQKQETPEKKTSKIFHTFCRRRSDLVWNFPLICFLKGSLTNNHSIFQFFKEHFMKHYRQIARKAVVLYKVGEGSYMYVYTVQKFGRLYKIFTKCYNQ